MTLRPSRCLLGLGIHTNTLTHPLRSFQLLRQPSNSPSPFHTISTALTTVAARHTHKKTTLASRPKAVARSYSPPPKSTVFQPRPKPSTSVTVDLSSRLNPPSSTLPPTLTVPSREPYQSFLSYAYRAGRAYLTFYKAGIKAIFANRRVASAVSRRLNAAQAHQLQSPSMSMSSRQGLQQTSGDHRPTRAEFQLVHRSKHDMNRVPVFALLFLILGEWLPLIVIFFTPLIPYTCRIPRQVEGDRRKIETRRSRSFRGEIDGRVPGPYVEGVQEQSVPMLVGECSKTQLLHISRSLGLHFRIWDTLTKGVWPPTFVLRTTVQERLTYLEQDDALLLFNSSGTRSRTIDASILASSTLTALNRGVRAVHGGDQLSSEEVKMACEERGIDVVGRSDEELRRVLGEWLKGMMHSKTLGMLLSRPNVWKDLEVRQHIRSKDV